MQPELPEHGDRTVWYRASAMNMAYADTEGEIRFYSLSARSMHEVLKGDSKKVGKSLVTPVVRIEVSVETLALLCRRLGELVDESEIPERTKG